MNSKSAITKTTRVKSIPRVCNIIWLSFLRHNKDLIQLATIERYSDKRNVLLVFFKDLWRLQKSFFTSCVCLSINYKLTKNVMKSIPIIPAFASIIRYYNVFSLYIFWGTSSNFNYLDACLNDAQSRSGKVILWDPLLDLMDGKKDI